MAELEAGGGQDDFAYTRDILLGDAATIAKLVTLCVKELQGQPEVMNRVVGMLTSCVEKGISVLTLRGLGLGEDANLSLDEGFDAVDDPPLERLVPALAHLATHGQLQHGAVGVSTDTALRRADGLPRQIVSPTDYSWRCSLTHTLRLSLSRATLLTLSYAILSASSSRKTYILARWMRKTGIWTNPWRTCSVICTMSMVSHRSATTGK